MDDLDTTIIAPLHEQQDENIRWSRESTLILIGLYKTWRSKVGSFDLKNLKKMWERISTIMKDIHEMNFSFVQCENRWKVLERNYKKIIDNNKKTGRGVKYFEFQKEMDDIYQKKKNVFPTILLSSTSEIRPVVPNATGDSEIGGSDVIQKNSDSTVCSTSSSDHDYLKSRTVESGSSKRKRKYAVKNSTEELRKELKEYHEQKLEIAEKRLKEQIRRNGLIEERNKILQCKCRNDPNENTNSFEC